MAKDDTGTEEPSHNDVILRLGARDVILRLGAIEREEGRDTVDVVVVAADVLPIRAVIDNMEEEEDLDDEEVGVWERLLVGVVLGARGVAVRP